MRGIMASLTMVSETSGSAGYFLASRRPGRASRVSAPPPAAREEDKARGPGEAPDYDRARPAQETGEPGREPVAALSANTSLSHGQSRFSRRSRSPAASASWRSAAGTRTPSSRPQVPSATCCLRLVTFFAASQPRDPPFASSSRSRIDRGHARARLTARAGAASPPDEGGSPPTRRRSRTCGCTRTPSARAERPGVATCGATDSRFARGRPGRPTAAACRSCAAAGPGGRDQGRKYGVLLLAERLPGAELADKGPALCCPQGVPPRRAAPFSEPPPRPFPLNPADFSNGLEAQRRPATERAR